MNKPELGSNLFIWLKRTEILSVNTSAVNIVEHAPLLIPEATWRIETKYCLFFLRRKEA